MSITPYVLHNIPGQYLSISTTRLQNTNVKLPMFAQKTTQSNLLIFNTQELASEYVDSMSDYQVSDIATWNDDKKTLRCPIHEQTNDELRVSNPLGFDILHQSDVTRMFLFGDWTFFLVTKFDINDSILSIQGVHLNTSVEMTDTQQYHMCIHELCRYT